MTIKRKHNEFISWLVANGFVLREGSKHTKVFKDDKLVYVFNCHKEDINRIDNIKRQLLRKAQRAA